MIQLNINFFYGFTYFSGLINVKLSNTKTLILYLSTSGIFNNKKWKNEVQKSANYIKLVKSRIWTSLYKIKNSLLKKNKIYNFISNVSDNLKFTKLSNLSNIFIFYLRKNKLFIKGRYSRNRQYYKTGVYWCLWVNIIAVFGLYFMFL